MFEVEAKFEVADHEAVRRRLAALGAVRVGAERQDDLFLRHPCRDMAALDETLRLRTRRLGDGGAGGAGGGRGAGEVRSELTYKGPRAKEDLKVRREATLHLQEDPLPLLALLGFAPGPVLRKSREDWTLGEVAVALDRLDGVGLFVEVEVVGADTKAAGALVDKVAGQLGLAARIDVPYIELARRKGLV